ncbi:MAG: type II/IV secretion system protein, partial [Opitutales bacterium]|nr:type II/IV secretion system protein [Opitutales bacterium]
MALGRLQAAIVDNLSDLSYLDGSQVEELRSFDTELNGNAFDRVLLGDYHISLHQLNIAKSKAYGVAPFNVKRLAINKGTWEVLDQEFCEKNGVIPVSVVSHFITVAFSNPFELTISTKIAERSGKQVIPLLSPERDIKEVLRQDTSNV